MASKYVEQFKKGLKGTQMFQTDRRQTDHVTEKCAAIGGIACAARSDSA